METQSQQPAEEPQEEALTTTDDEGIEPQSLGDVLESLKETGTKLKNAVLYPAWKMLSTYVEGTTEAVDGLADGLKGNKKKGKR